MAHLSRMSAITQAYMSSPSGNWRATRLAPFCLMRHTVLWICRLSQQRHTIFTPVQQRTSKILMQVKQVRAQHQPGKAA